MKKYLKILLLLLISFGLKAQTLLPANLPNPKAPTAFYWIGWMKTDSGIINAVRDTTFRPRYAGTQIMWQHAGTDTLLWWWTGQRWLSPSTSGGGGGNFTSFSFTNQNGITGTVSQATGPNVNLSLGTNLNGIVNANGSGFGTVTIGAGLTYVGNTLSAVSGTALNALISGNGSNFIATTIGAGLSYSTVTHTLVNTIVNNNQLINGAGYISNVTGYIQAGTNISIAGSGTLASPYIISSTGGGSVTGAGNLSPLFTTSLSAGTINFAFTNPVAFQIFGNPQGTTAAPMYFGINSTLAFSGNLLGVNTSAPLNFYQTISQVDSFTFTLNTPTGRHDTVRISLPTNGFVSNLNNGLTLTGSLGQLGGPLVQNTVINGGGFSLGIQGNRFATGMGAAIAAANNLTTGSDGNLFNVTGLTQINAITTTNWQAGAEISFIFTSTPILKNNTAGGGGTAPMLLAGSIDYQAAPGDYIKLQYDGTAWHEVTRKLTSAGGAYIFSNGITESPATRVKLGGTLTQNTTIAGASTFYLAISNGRFQTGAGAAIAAANNLVTGNDGNQFSTTGNTQINAITTSNWQAGAHIELIFTGTPLLKNNTAGGVNTAVMLLAGSVDYQAASGDLIGFSYDGTVWHETNRKLAGSTTNLSFNNGITATGNLVQLGGTLVQATTIDATASYNLLITGAGASQVLRVNSTGGGAAITVNTNGDGVRSTASAGGTAMFGSSSGIGVYGFSSGASGSGGFFQATGGSNGSAVLASSGAAGTFVYDGLYSDASTNSVVTVNRMIRNTTGLAASGIGQSIDFDISTTTGVTPVANQIISKWLDATNATRQSQLVITGVTNAVLGTYFSFDGSLSTSYVPIASLQTLSSTNTVVPQMFLQRLTSGTPGNGIGNALYYQIQNTTNTLSSGSLEVNLTNATGGSTSSQYNLKLLNNSSSLTTALTVDGNGNITTTGGYIDHIVTVSAGTYVITATDLTVVFTGTTSTFTFPTAVLGRRLNLVNNGSGTVTYGTAVTIGNGSTTTTSTAGNKDQVQYDGTVWRKIN